MLRGVSLWQKIALLAKIYLAKFHIIKMIWAARPVPLNDTSRDMIAGLGWDSIQGCKYKKIPDPTGEYRFYVPDLSLDVAWRIDPKYSLRHRHDLPEQLMAIAERVGRKNPDIARMVFEENKSFVDGRFE